MDALRDRALHDPVLNKMWKKFLQDRVEVAMNTKVVIPFDQEDGRDYGDAMADLTIAYIITRDIRYVKKAKRIALDLADAKNWGTSDWEQHLAVAHISIGYAFCWDVMHDHFSSSERDKIRDGAIKGASNLVSVNQLSNHNWTPSAAEGLLALAFKGEVDFDSGRLERAKNNFKEAPRSVLWAHGADGFSPQGLGYWRKYNHVALFFTALRYNEPENDWFRLGKEFPGSDFFQKSSFPRIYTDVQHPDMSCITWGDSQQIGTEAEGPFGCMGMLALSASEYDDGYALDFLKTIVNESRYRFEDEDAAAFIFYDPSGVPSQSYRDLPLSGYWPNMEGAVFRSGWDKNDMVFFMRCGSQGGHAAMIKDLPRDGHSHPDANGFVLYYNNDYLAAEDGAKPNIGPQKGLRITYGHNTLLVDGRGQKGDRGTRIPSTNANMDFLDAKHVGYLLGDATDAYKNLDQFYRYLIYKKHKYFIIVDEIKDNAKHKYEFLLGTDKRHFIEKSGEDTFYVRPSRGSAQLPIVFVEPQNLDSKISTSRPYAIGNVMVDLLKVWPDTRSRNATFFALLYPQKENAPAPNYRKIYDGGRSGIVVDDDEYYLYNQAASLYTYRSMSTDAKLSYHKDDPNAFEYLAAGCKELSYMGSYGFTSSEPLVAAFEDRFGQIRLGKNLGTDKEATITLRYPGATGVLVDGQTIPLTGHASGSVSFKLLPKQYQTGPSGYEQTVTDNYAIEILTDGAQPFVQVTRPNGGESWQVGGLEAVTWNSDAGFSAAKLEYSTDGGSAWQLITSGTNNDGAYDWTIPDDLSNTCLVRISDAADGSPADVSDGAFAIVDAGGAAPRIDSFSPTAGPPGTTVSISGEHFLNATQVQFNGASATFAIETDQAITATVPNDAATGRISISNASGTGSSSSDFVVSSGGNTVSLLPSDDGQVKLTAGGKNYGAKPTAKVAKGRFVFYLKFQVPVLSGQVASARLRLQVTTGATDGSKDGGSIYLVSNDYKNSNLPWDEDGLTADNAPDIQGQPLATAGTVAANSVVEFDLTTAIRRDGVYSFAIKNSITDQAKYETLQGSFPPELMVVTAGGGGPQEYNLTVITQGQGTVTLDPAGGRYASGTEVELSAVPATDWRFAGWSGDLSGAANPASILMTANREVTALFEEQGSAGTVAFTPVADAYVRSSRPTTNYGDRIQLAVKNSSTKYRTFLRFDIAGLTAPVNRATLELYVVDRSSVGGGVYSVSNNYKDSGSPWQEDSITWQNAPDVTGAPMSTLGVVAVGHLVELDVTPAVAGNGTISLALHKSSGGKAAYSSREGSHPPRLVLELADSGGGNQAPLARDDEVNLGTNLTAVVNVLENDNDPDGSLDATSVSVLTPPEHGAADVNPFSGLITYTPDAGFSGQDQLRYDMADDEGLRSNPATVRFTVGAAGGTTTLTFTPTDDNQVKLTAPGKNYGAKATAKVEKNKFVAYFKFEVTGSGTAQSATLRLYVASASVDGGSVYLTSNTFAGTTEPWLEEKLNADNAPVLPGSPVATIGPVQAGRYIEVDVSSAIAGGGTYTFAISSNSRDRAKYTTKEDSRPPELVVTFSDQPVSAEALRARDETARQSAFSEGTPLPGAFSLSANYPNPFNGDTVIRYALPRAARVRVTVYDIRGREVHRLVDGSQPAGFKTVTWNGRNRSNVAVSSGVYLLHADLGGRVFTTKMVLQK